MSISADFLPFLEIPFLSMKTFSIVQSEPKLCREAKGSKSQPILIMVTALYLVSNNNIHIVLWYAYIYMNWIAWPISINHKRFRMVFLEDKKVKQHNTTYTYYA